MRQAKQSMQELVVAVQQHAQLIHQAACCIFNLARFAFVLFGALSR